MRMSSSHVPKLLNIPHPPSSALPSNDWRISCTRVLRTPTLFYQQAAETIPTTSESLIECQLHARVMRHALFVLPNGAQRLLKGPLPISELVAAVAPRSL